MNFEILQIIASFITPLTILLLGIVINKSIEKNKISILKEKEWQVSWAETFLKKAIELNEHVSMIIILLYHLNSKSTNKDLKEKINTTIFKLHYLEWDIRNFVQFAENKDELINKQVELLTIISKIFEEKQGDLEAVRKIQADYNCLVRIAHNNILNSKNRL